MLFTYVSAFCCPGQTYNWSQRCVSCFARCYHWLPSKWHTVSDFAIGVEPILALLQQAIGSLHKTFPADLRSDRGVCRACADDIGAVLRSLYILKDVANVFQSTAQLSGLHLGASKCNIIPLVPDTTGWESILKNWLSLHIPQWSDFNVCKDGVYLSFLLGPQAGTKAWDAVLDKWMQRARLIAASDAQLAVKIHNYPVRAVPTIQYVAQLLPPTVTMSRMDRRVAAMLLKLPYTALSHSALLHYHEWTRIQIPSIIVNAKAAHIRAMRRTIC